MALDVEMLTVGPVQENCFLVRREGADKLLVVDPGEEAERILLAIEQTGAKVEAILITHCHFDHIGAVAPVAAATGAPVYCPQIEVPVLADIMSF
ncbi:MAG: hydroxyacylglutathione hydrolase, partial [Solirubrobacterales bacterium]|nr:hydroxyacylglutathione hydrolase [Solirubrobacterales bacterium]